MRKLYSNAVTINTNFMPDFKQKIQHCYHSHFFVTKDMGKKNFHRRCLERINLSWFVATLSSAKTKHLLGILNCRHFDWVCFYGNIVAPIPSRAEIAQVTLIMRSHFAAVSVLSILKNPRIAGFFASLPFLAYLSYKRLKPSTHCVQL